MRFWISPRARRDLHEIWLYIAQDNEDAADRWYDAMRRHFELLGLNPKIGRRRDEWGRTLRSFADGEYVVAYTIQKPGVRIVRVLHGRRDLPKLFLH